PPSGHADPRPAPTGQAQPLPPPTGQAQPLPPPKGQAQPLPPPTGQAQPLPPPTGQAQPLPPPTGHAHLLPPPPEVARAGEWRQLSPKMLAIYPFRTVGALAVPALIAFFGVGQGNPDWLLRFGGIFAALAVLGG